MCLSRALYLKIKYKDVKLLKIINYYFFCKNYDHVYARFEKKRAF
jgi:hypothetical protein